MYLQELKKKSHKCSLVLPVQQLCLFFRTDKTMTIFSELNPYLVCTGKHIGMKLIIKNHHL